MQECDTNGDGELCAGEKDHFVEMVMKSQGNPQPVIDLAKASGAFNEFPNTWKQC